MQLIPCICTYCKYSLRALPPPRSGRGSSCTLVRRRIFSYFAAERFHALDDPVDDIKRETAKRKAKYSRDTDYSYAAWTRTGDTE